MEDGYDFWLYLPESYEKAEELPLVMFLHGKSLSGDSLEMVLQYGSIHALFKGRAINAIVVAPQAQSAWEPKRVMTLFDWLDDHYKVDTNRFYVLGMSMGGYGALDVATAYPDRVAAAMAMCGGASGKELCGLSTLPLWIIHGTADRSVKIEESQKVVEGMKKAGVAQRLRYEWIKGASHGDLARYFYLSDTYDWLFMHTLNEPVRPVDTSIQITADERSNAYRSFTHRKDELDIR